MMMRPFLLALVVLAGLASPASSEAGEAKAPFALLKDDIYRGEGVIPSVKTCLAVADDAEAVKRNEDLGFHDPENESRLAGDLQGWLAKCADIGK